MKNGFGIVSVANPDSYVADGGPYTTINEDAVIFFVPGAMPGQFNNFGILGFNPADWSGHKFIESYMASGHPAETKITNNTLSTINRLKWPEGGCQQLLLITASVENGPPCVVLFDLDSNSKATTIPNNTGGYASFPCNESEISNWLSTVSKNGSSPLSINASSPTTHINTIGVSGFWKFKTWYSENGLDILVR